MYHWLKICAVCCHLVLLSACSSTTFVYNRLDFIVPWYVDDYVELNREQEQFLDERLRPFLDWHRAEELPRYLTLLDEIESGLDREQTPEHLATIFLEFEAAWFRIEEQGLPGMLNLGAELSDEQVAEFMHSLWHKQEEYEEEYLQRSDEESREDSCDDFLDRMRDLVGRLSRQQRQPLEASCDSLLRSDQIWLQERSDWLQRLGGILIPRQTDWQRQVTLAVQGRSEHVSEEYLKTYQNNLDVIEAGIAAVINSRTEKQDRHLRKRLSGLRDDIEVLIAQGLSAPVSI